MNIVIWKKQSKYLICDFSKCFSLQYLQMTRRITGDQNNISSKLLGANLADINIEKFRDLTNYKKNKYQIQGKLSVPILKTITNKFSPALMFTIVLPNQAISRVDALAQCQNVVILNLSHNTIQDISPLANLKQLKIVDLSDNSIANVDCFQGFQDLVNLKLQGNMVKSLQSLKALQSCQKLKNLHLQTLSGDGQNPICQLNGYRDNLLGFVSQITRLDSIPKGLNMNNGSQLKSEKKKELKIELKQIGPFYCTKFPSGVPYTVPSFPGEAPLKRCISDCKSSINQLQLRLKAAMAL